jgi:hypothetical protein
MDQEKKKPKIVMNWLERRKKKPRVKRQWKNKMRQGKKWQ